MSAHEFTRNANQEVFNKALRETQARHLGIAGEVKRVYPELLALWNRDFEQVRVQLAHKSNFKQFMVTALHEVELQTDTKQAIVEFTKTLGGVLNRPDIRKVAVATAHKYEI